MTSHNLRILAAVLSLILAALLFDGAAQATDFQATDLKTIERTVLVDDIAWYRVDLRVGPGPHDTIRLHRIVREQAPWHPIAAPRGVFLTHGDGWGFNATFLGNLAAPGIDADQNLPVYLAKADVDVWGLDFRWALVPAGTTDLSFMADWGFDTSLADLDLALTTARWTRLATGSGFSRLHLLGYSRGGRDRRPRPGRARRSVALLPEPRQRRSG